MKSLPCAALGGLNHLSRLRPSAKQAPKQTQLRHPAAKPVGTSRWWFSLFTCVPLQGPFSWDSNGNERGINEASSHWRQQRQTARLEKVSQPGVRNKHIQTQEQHWDPCSGIMWLLHSHPDSPVPLPHPTPPIHLPSKSTSFSHSICFVHNGGRPLGDKAGIYYTLSLLSLRWPVKTVWLYLMRGGGSQGRGRENRGGKEGKIIKYATGRRRSWEMHSAKIHGGVGRRVLTSLAS